MTNLNVNKTIENCMKGVDHLKKGSLLRQFKGVKRGRHKTVLNEYLLRKLLIPVFENKGFLSWYDDVHLVFSDRPKSSLEDLIIIDLQNSYMDLFKHLYLITGWQEILEARENYLTYITRRGEKLGA